MKKITLFVVALALCLVSSAQLPTGGTYTVGTGGDYATLKAAFDAVNAADITGDVTLSVISNLTETTNPGLVNNTAHSITITSDDVTERVVTFNDAGALIADGPAGAIRLGTKGDWNLIPANNITIKNLTLITAATQNGFNGPISINGACDNVNIDNCIITHNGTAGTLGSNNSIAIALRTATDALSGGNIMPSNTTISNCQITSTARANSVAIASFSSLMANTNAFQNGAGGTPAVPTTLLSGLKIASNSIKAQRIGIVPNYINSETVLIDKNEIRINQTANQVAWAIYIDNADNKFNNIPYTDAIRGTISNNRLVELKAFSTGAGGVEGIHIGNKSYFLVYNNFITGFDKTNAGTQTTRLRATYIGSGGNFLLYNNTIVLNSLTNTPNNSNAPNNAGIANYAAIQVGGYARGVLIATNNIIISKEDASPNFLICESLSSGYFSNIGRSSDYNVLYLAGGNTNARFINDPRNPTTVYDTHEGYKAYVGPEQDANGKSVNVTFADEATGNLHLAGASILDVNLKVPTLAQVATDIDDEARSGDTYAGADQSDLPFTVTSTSKITDRSDVIVVKTATGVQAIFSGEATVELYNVNGALLDKTIAHSVYTKTLKSGIYVLKVNNDVLKVVL